MTIGELFTKKVRPLISDEVSPYRWDDADLISRTNDELQYIWGIHPEDFNISEIVIEPPTEITSTADDVPLVSTRISGLSYMIAASCLRDDSEDGANSKTANEFRQLAEVEL